jgi:hypothetical protein
LTTPHTKKTRNVIPKRRGKGKEKGKEKGKLLPSG